MYGHPKELASHGAEFPCVSARARAYYGRSVQLTDFLDWREQHIHLAASFLVSVGDTLLQVRSGLERERASGARIKDGRKVSLYLMCGSHPSCVVQAWVPLRARVSAWSAQHRGRFVLPVRFVVGEREAQWVTGKVWRGDRAEMSPYSCCVAF